MRVLVACEYSGIVRDAFLSAGHEALSCDLLPTESPGPHHQGDIFEVLDDSWDLMIAHPPCTYLCNSGVCWLHKREGRWAKMEEGARFFKRLLEAPIPKIAVENPVMHRYAVEIIGRRQDQIVQPWMFGHTEQKATGLWLKGLPLLKPTLDVKEKMMKLPERERSRIWYMGGGKGKERSRFFSGIAEAMVEQWS